MMSVIKRHTLISYFVLAYLLTWLVEFALVAKVQGRLQNVPFWIHYLASFGPMLAALIVTWIASGVNGIHHLLLPLLRVRDVIRWVLVAIFLPVGLFGIALLYEFFINGASPNWGLLGEVDYLPYLGGVGAFLLWLVTFGVGEEIGWRGFALPRLQQQHSAQLSTIILSTVWCFWHLPAFFYKDTYIAMGLFPGILLFYISIFAASIVFTWLYNSARGSLFVVVLFHALFDFLSVSQAGGSLAPALMSAVIMLLAVTIVVIYKTANLSHRAKYTHKD